jgi:hypothetical protein
MCHAAYHRDYKKSRLAPGLNLINMRIVAQNAPYAVCRFHPALLLFLLRAKESLAQSIGSAKPFWRQKAVSVFRKRQAMVIGPTPPGTGVICAATSAAWA